jgi:hypothetical protein
LKEEAGEEGPPVIPPGRQCVDHAILETYWEADVKAEMEKGNKFQPMDKGQGTLA